MKKILMLILFFYTIFSTGIIFAQEPDTVWTNYYWNGYYDTVNCLQETPDKGLIMAGVTFAPVTNEVSINLVKTDSLGNEEWTTLIGQDGYQECAYHVLNTSDSGFLVSADSYDFSDYSRSIYIVKTDAVGDTTWSYLFKPAGKAGYPLYAIETVDSGFAITGAVIVYGYHFDAFILQLDKDGALVDYDSYGTYGIQDGKFIMQMPDSGFMVAGNADGSVTWSDFWVFRTTQNGAMLWDSIYAMTDYYDEMHGACSDVDGIVLVGEARGTGHALKVDFDGIPQWSKDISTYPTGEEINSICVTSEGGYMVGGWTGVVGHNRDYCLTKLNHVGETLWTFTVGGGDNDHGRSVIETYDGGYALAGHSDSFENGGVFYLVKINNPGCCLITTGNVDNDQGDICDISDLLYLVDFLFVPGSPGPVCEDEANVDGLVGVDISDLLYLVDYMFSIPIGPAPVECP